MILICHFLYLHFEKMVKNSNSGTENDEFDHHKTNENQIGMKIDNTNLFIAVGYVLFNSGISAGGVLVYFEFYDSK